MSVSKDFLPIAGASGNQGTASYAIDQSIKFNGPDTAGLHRTVSSGGNTDKWTFSCWAKRGRLGQSGGGGSHQALFTAGSAVTDFTSLMFRDSASLPSGGVAESLNFNVNDSTNNPPLILSTTQVFRDTSAWYHIVAIYDSGNAIRSERGRLYINGLRVTQFNVEAYPTQDYDSEVNKNANKQRIGYLELGSNEGHFDGYIAEIHLLDGYAYGPEYFGEFDSSGIWIAKQYSTGDYGTNGFYIKGQDSSDLGNDSSGNNNDFTNQNLATVDQQPDSPTNNHAVFNPLDVAHNGYTVFSEGNLAITYSGSSARELARSTIKMPANSDAFFEVKMTATLGSGVDFAIGIEDGSALQDASNTTYTNAYVIREDGTFSTTGSSSTTSYGVSFTNNDVIGVWRKANGDLVFYKNGTAMNSGTPAVTGVTGEMHFVAGGFNGGAGIARFASGQWTNTPTGVQSSMALTTTNLFTG